MEFDLGDGKQDYGSYDVKIERVKRSVHAATLMLMVRVRMKRHVRHARGQHGRESETAAAAFSDEVRWKERQKKKTANNTRRWMKKEDEEREMAATPRRR